jgi:hypothetical protein
MKRTLCVLFCAVFCLSAPAAALVLNGKGLRTATWFKVKVYEASLFLTQKETSADAILASGEPKRLELAFLREVSADDIQKAWKDSFEKNCKTDCEADATKLAQIKAMVTSVKEGEKMLFELNAQGVTPTIGGKTAAPLLSPSFSRNFLAIWLGDHPPNESLKQGLLGTP